MVNEWTRDDLPRVADVRGPADTPSAAAAFYAVDEAFDAVVEHLNRRFPKVPPVLVMPDLERPESEVDRWRRAHSIVEGERDQARESLRRLRDETDFDLFTVRDQLKQCRGEREQMTRDRDEWRTRAEAAEARTAPAVTVEQRNAVADHLWNAMVGSAKSVVRDVVAQAFADAGIETGQAVDPVEAEAVAAFKKAWHEADAEGDAGNRTVRGIRAARRVLGQEAGDE